jgi:hypothetical protein
MYAICIAGEAAPPWVQLLDAWRRLAGAAFPLPDTFPPPAVPAAAESQPSSALPPLFNEFAAAESQPSSDLPPLFNEFKQWAQRKGLCRYAARSSFLRFRAV